MATCFLALLGAVLLFVDPSWTALTWHEFPSEKFFLNLLTYQLDHAHFWHFWGNWTFMAVPALYLEHRIGWKKFLGFYFAAGVMSALVFWMSDQGSLGMIGSSGSAFGVFAGACLAFNNRPWKALAGFLWLGIALCVEFLAAVHANPVTNIAYWGHLGGAAAGAVLAYYLVPFRGFEKPYKGLRRRRRRRSKGRG